ncbi:MAG: T9SS type A sorting domain-containing protein [Candidatus Kapabacteria bacterium]|nr:T9SS type A sorting domain-containing protein [Candidatus Kapabacteria bacterium]
MRLILLFVFMILVPSTLLQSEQVAYTMKDNSLKVSIADLYTNCCSSYIGDYSINQEENTIRIVITDTSSKRCRCMCNIDLEYTVANIQKGKYKVFVYLDELKKFDYPKDIRRLISRHDIELAKECLEEEFQGKLKQSVCKTTNSVINRSEMKSEIEVFPNPSNSMVTIRFYLKERNDVEIKILNFLGKDLMTMEYTGLPEGVNTVSFSAGDLPSGMYLGKLMTKSGNVSSFKVVWSK